VRRIRQKKGTLLGSHQKCWLWGRNTVLETLRAGRWRPVELRLSEELPAADVGAVAELVGTAPIPLHRDPAARLAQLCGSREHQGYLAKMPEFPYDAPEGVLAGLSDNPLCLVLDGIQDPHNFGAVLRSAEVLGVDAVFVGEVRQVDVTSQVVRSSAGAVNFVRLSRVSALPHLLANLKSRGLSVVGASEKGSVAPAECDLKRPTALVIGNEGTGLSDEVLAVCDERIAIPQHGRVGSLNAAVAAGILVYEAKRQRS
jgi:23S rRNA (guanosine2251-2'-O)-methyltransferase